ncbi:head maturation protease, ClpP-related [Clostridium butyricum]|uniref:head maturation protease, ClpP-related n=1 Tax=Clostridium butyricum TaxID=1492 RepID=UPI0022E283B9|nr:head maturation protease, ClpP-related [Clostridium butyricum]
MLEKLNNQKLLIVNDSSISKGMLSVSDKKFWDFNYVEDEEVELTIYGEIVSSLSWWDSSGQVASNDFIKELDSYKDKDNITVRINSNGGDVFAATAIYTILRDMKANIKVKIDGMCMSAATIIAMAGESEISPCAVFMTHPPLAGLCGYFNSSDLDEYKIMLDKVKDIIMNAYQYKTSKTKDELETFLNGDNWMTAEEAVENGFIDKVMFDDEEYNPVIDKNMLIINKVGTDLSNMPDDFKEKIKDKISKNSLRNSSGNSNLNNQSYFFNKLNNKRGDDDVIKNAHELKDKYPDVYKEVVKAAQVQERERIKAIDGLPGANEIKNKAKYEEIIDAGQCAVLILNAQKQQGQDYLNNRDDDIRNSGADDVKPTSTHERNIAKDGYDIDETESILDRALGKRGIR